MRKVALGLFALTMIGTSAVPALADEVNLQNVQQISTQEGDYNQTFQRSSQTIRSNRSSNQRQVTPSSSGNVQDLLQDAYQSGSRNSGRQTNVQEIEMRSRYRR